MSDVVSLTRSSLQILDKPQAGVYPSRQRQKNLKLRHVDK